MIREQLGKVQFKTTEVHAAAQLQRDSRASDVAMCGYSCIKAGRVGVMGVVLESRRLGKTKH